MLAQFRQGDRQPLPEEIKPDRQVIQENRQEIKPDYQAMRDRILKSLVTGRGKVATTSPQYKTAKKVLDKFIAELTSEKSA